MTDRVVFHRMPPDPERLVWCEWLRRHGIDPCRVAVDFIERREDTYQIVYATYEVAYSQVPRRVPPSVTDYWDGAPVTVEDYEIQREVLKVEKVFQLEAKPLPWPPVPPWPGGDETDGGDRRSPVAADDHRGHRCACRWCRASRPGDRP